MSDWHDARKAHPKPWAQVLAFNGDDGYYLAYCLFEEDGSRFWSVTPGDVLEEDETIPLSERLSNADCWMELPDPPGWSE